jgi:lipopolysaccharide export LptBFGC system permease protein LptF
MMSLPVALTIIFSLILLELFVLSVWLQRQGKTALIAPLMTFLASGALLMGAIGIAAGSQGDDPLILALIALSFPAHLATLWLVWRLTSER